MACGRSVTSRQRVWGVSRIGQRRGEPEGVGVLFFRPILLYATKGSTSGAVARVWSWRRCG
eukprot:6399077-Prymnesium_polylepis.2